MNELFPYANTITGLLVLIVGFLFHWVGQLISIVNWELAVRIGLQEKDMPREYKVYEHAIAKADVALGWLHGVAGVGLVLGCDWGPRLAWIPGVVFVYHGLSAAFWHQNQKSWGVQITPDSVRVVWCTLNIATGILAAFVAWNAG